MDRSTARESRRPEARLRRWFAGLPGWVHALVGLAAVVLGVLILLRPTTSLGVLVLLIGVGLGLAGVLELVGGGDAGQRDRTPRWRVLLAGVWIAAGLVVLAWPGLTVRVVALAVGIALIVNGAITLLAAFRRRITVDERIASGAFGAAGVVFGVLALAWPDITLLIVALVFGARLIMGGIAQLWVLFPRPAREPEGDREQTTDAPPRRSALSRWVRTTAALVALVLAGVAASVSLLLQSATPIVDDFYVAPQDVPDEPGSSSERSRSRAACPKTRAAGASSTRRPGSATSPRSRAGSFWCPARATATGP